MINFAPVRIAVIGDSDLQEFLHNAKVKAGKDRPTIGNIRLMELVKRDIRAFGDIKEGFAISWCDLGDAGDAIGMFSIKNNQTDPYTCSNCTFLCVSQLLATGLVPFPTTPRSSPPSCWTGS